MDMYVYIIYIYIIYLYNSMYMYVYTTYLYIYIKSWVEKILTISQIISIWRFKCIKVILCRLWSAYKRFTRLVCICVCIFRVFWSQSFHKETISKRYIAVTQLLKKINITPTCNQTSLKSISWKNNKNLTSINQCWSKQDGELKIWSIHREDGGRAG